MSRDEFVKERGTGMAVGRREEEIVKRNEAEPSASERDGGVGEGFELVHLMEVLGTLAEGPQQVSGGQAVAPAGLLGLLV